MNWKGIIGSAYEEKAIPFLKKIFDEVEWTSKKFHTGPYDFTCIKDGKIFYGDSKPGPEISKNKSNKLDFIIFPSGDTFEIVYKKDFNSLRIIDSTLVRISNSTKNKLDKLKKGYNDSYGDVIERILLSM